MSSADLYLAEADKKKQSGSRWSFVKILLVLLNVASTGLTLFTGLRENPLIVDVTGRYDGVRQRLIDGSINTEIARPEVYRLDALVPLPDIGKSYRFITAPRRDPSTIGEYRSVCTNINSNTAPVLALVYDDFWGKGARRVQIFVYSISAPQCDVINVKPSWRTKCVADRGNNATACHKFILDNFDTLREDRTIQVSSQKDFGDRGVPFLRCLGRPATAFDFKADLLAHQSYWEGGSYHIMIQTSECVAKPLLRNADLKYTLFESTGVDEGANVLLALPPAWWFAWFVTQTYSVVTLAMITRGLVKALLHNRTVQYLPNDVRYSKERRFLRYLVPFMPASIYFSEHSRLVIMFKGSLLVASDIWMNHWLYMYLSILDAVTNIRLTYITLQVGTWMLNMKITMESFLFLCAAIMKITWIMCLVQTLTRASLKLSVRCLRSVRLIRSVTREKLEWNIDGASMFLTYKLFNLLLCFILFMLLLCRGSTTFMVRADPYKVGAFGGIPKTAIFWRSEIICDLFTLLAIMTVIAQLVGVGFLMTKYKYAADNSLMRLLQQRYGMSGWDGLLAAGMLGLDPTDPDFIVNGHGRTKFCIGSLLQLLYLSGPSAFVHLAGDYIFHNGGFTKDPVKFRFPVASAAAMGLFETSRRGSIYSKGVTNFSSSSKALSTVQRQSTNGLSKVKDSSRVSSQTGAARVSSYNQNNNQKVSIFERTMRVVSEGYLGKVLLVDEAQPGLVSTDKDTGMREYVVIDALATISILDVKYLLGNEKKLRSD